MNIKRFLQVLIGNVGTIVVSVIITKLISFYSGSVGLAKYTYLRDINKFFYSIGTLNSEITLLNGASSKNIRESVNFLCVSLKLLLYNLLFFLTIFLLFNSSLCGLFYKNIQIDHISFNTFAIASLLFSSNIILTTIHNRNRDYYKVSISTIVGFFASAFYYFFNKHSLGSANILSNGFLILMLLTLLINLLFTIKSFLLKDIYFAFRKKKIFISLEFFKNFFTLTLSNFIPSIVGYITIFYIRRLIEIKYGLHNLGFFDASWTMGSVFFMMILSSLTSHTVSLISEEDDNFKINTDINKSIKLCTLFFILGAYTFLCFSNFFYKLFFTADFIQSKDILFYIFVGDLIKISSYFISYFLILKNRKKEFIFSALIFNIAFLIFSTYLLKFGMIYVSFAYIVSNLFYFIYIYFNVRKLFAFRLSNANVFLTIASITGLFILQFIQK